MTSRYIVGIDLGTTHTVVAYTETDNSAAIQLFNIEQLVGLGEVAARPLLPSLRYHPAADELSPADLQLPWVQDDNAIVGTLARQLGAQVPGRLVASAKSWLSHPSVDRTAAILPWGAAEEIDKISPVAASASYLRHVRRAWDHQFPDHPLQQQRLVLTVPASFDEAARALTLEAARLAGLPQMRLVEEPQAAMYDWLYRHRQDQVNALGKVRLVLVCDVGGGTTDLTLIKISHGPTGPQLTRIGVGDHLMLGGDNMDLGLAHLAESRLATDGARLGTARLSQLLQQCRNAKEQLLAENAPEQISVTLLGSGAKLIGGTRSTELARDEVWRMLLDGFFPVVAADEQRQRSRGGIVEFGLPYAADPAITRHVAAFLNHHARASREALGSDAPDEGLLPTPDALLLNGGVFRSSALTERLIDVISSWRGGRPTLLSNPHPDTAVACGAVAYGLATLGKAPKIGGGSARSYFLLLGGDTQNQNQNQNRQGICVLPRGSEEGHEIQLSEQTFALRLGQPVSFRLMSSTADTEYQVGQIVDLIGDEFSPLPPLVSVMRHEADTAERELPVQLTATLTEVGTLEMYCVSLVDSSQRWKLEFQLRGQGNTHAAAERVNAQLPPQFSQSVDRIHRIYDNRSHEVQEKEVKRLRSELEKQLGDRNHWDTPLLRELFTPLMEGGRKRRRTADHERVWFSLTGFCLRPGFGYPLDDWRVQQLWSIYEQGVQYGNENQNWSEWWTLWRRIAGGLDEQAQTQILNDIAYYLQPPGKSHVKRSGPKRQGYDDMVRVAAALERVSAQRKEEIGGWLAERLRKPSENSQTWWAVGRIGARVPFHGSAHNVVARSVAEEWLKQLLTLDWKKIEPASFAATLLARVSGDRERDLDQTLRNEVQRRLENVKAPASWLRMVQEVVELDESDERRMFGEALPAGLKLLA